MTTLPSAHRANGLPPSAEHHGTCSSRAPREVRPEKVPAPFRVPVPPRQGRAAPFPWRRAVSANRERRSTGGASRRANGERRCCGARWQRARRVSLGPSVRPRAEMGGGGSTRRVTFEADENENITVVKGVRLSDSVIDRMKEPSSATGRQHRAPVSDEELKKRIAEELALERARRDSEAQKRRLKQEQMYVRDEFGKLLERERISSNEHLTRAILRERAATEEERQKAQRFVSAPMVGRVGLGQGGL
uniref:Coiled-coil-helix-coiled-coil-helix domain containing 3 n=1 Tax=Serinus canaria TaxID=9135 RepID=A0A8C9UFM5_SERCA